MSKVAVIYWSGSGNTEKMAELIAQGASEGGAEVVCKHVADAVPEDLAGCDAVAFGSPALGDETVEESELKPFLLSVLPALSGKRVALFGSYGWGDGAWMRSWTTEIEGRVTLVTDGLAVRETPEGESAAQCVEYGRKLAG